MFKDVGLKIRMFSIVLFAIEFIGSIVAAVLLWDSIETGFALLILIGGVFVSYLSALILYGYGQLIENSDTIAKNTDFNRISFSVTEEEEEEEK